MSLDIPVSPKITYRRNFLQSVICQVRVNPIFRVAKELPSEFQEAIRQDYPRAELRESIEIKVSEEGITPPEKLGKAWRFSSEDGDWTVTLDARFIAIDTKKYLNFEDFLTRFKGIHKPYCEIYSPSSAERVGLRYINAISPSEQLRAPKDWNAWVNPDLLGFAGTGRLSFPVGECFEVVRAPQGLGSITVRHGFNSDPTDKVAYLIDVDRYTDGKAEQSGIEGLLKEFNDECYNFFEWAVSKATKDWMRRDG